MRVRPAGRSRRASASPETCGRLLAPGEDWAALLRDGRVRLHVSHCTTARIRLAAQLPGPEIADLPATLAVGPACGLAVLRDVQPGPEDLALFSLGEGASEPLRGSASPR